MDYRDEVEMHVCPACEHEQDESECFMGNLGALRHYSCRYCGSWWSEA